MKKNRKINETLLVIIIAVVAVIIFFVFVGPITIYSPNFTKSRLYQITLNDENLLVDVEDNEKKTIIPFILNLKRSTGNTYGDKYMAEFSLGEELILDVKSFECFTKENNHLSCGRDNGELRKEEKNDVKYHLFIRKSSKGEKVFYDGELIDEVGHLLTEKGRYLFIITATYDDVESILYTNIKIK